MKLVSIFLLWFVPTAVYPSTWDLFKIKANHYYYFYKIEGCEDCFDAGNQFSVVPAIKLLPGKVALELGLELGLDLQGNTDLEERHQFDKYFFTGTFLNKAAYDYIATTEHRGFSLTPLLQAEYRQFFFFWGTHLRFDFWTYRENGKVTFNIPPGSEVINTKDGPHLGIHEGLVYGFGYTWKWFQVGLAVKGIQYSDIGTYISFTWK
jgi:hypothetical protein